MAIKEVEEETGLVAKVSRLLAVYDKRCHPHPPQPFYVYKMVFLCEALGEGLHTGFDISEARYFDLEALPELSQDRILASQIKQLYQLAINQNKGAYFD